MKLEREFFIPKGALCVRDKGSSAVAYVFDNAKGSPAVKVFSGKRAKPDGFYRFASEAAREAYVKRYFVSVQQIEGAKIQRRKERNAFRHSYKVGDIFRASWGYDQTNIDYYEIVALVGECFAKVRKIGALSEDQGWLRGKCVPAPGKFIGDAFKVKLAEGGFKVASYAWARYLEPKIVAGAKVYDADSWTAYA